VIVITFNTVISKKLYVQIYEQILSGIQSGIFQVGDKLPSERELCIHFGVSRAPIRQALSALEMNGFISSRQGDGVFVKDTQATAIKNVLEIVAESVSPEDILEARLVIESLIIKFAALRVTDEEIENLNKIVRKMEIETKQGIYAPETDEELHHSIAKASHNELFIAFMASIGKARLCNNKKYGRFFATDPLHILITGKQTSMSTKRLFKQSSPVTKKKQLKK